MNSEKLERLPLASACVLALLAVAGCSSTTDSSDSEDTEATAQELTTGIADWAQLGRSPRRTSYNPLESEIGATNVASLVTVWSCCAGAGVRQVTAAWRDRLFVSNAYQTTSVGGVESEAWAMLALNPASGDQYWRAPNAEDEDGTFDWEPFTSEMSVGYGQIHVQHTNFSPLLSTSTGKLIGRTGLGTGMDDRISAPLLKGDTLVVEVGADYYSDVDDYRRSIYAVDISTNTFLWRQAIGSSSPETRNPALANGHVFTVHGDENRLLSIDAAAGSTVWSSSPTPGQMGSPSVQGGRVFIVSRPNTLQAYDERTGSLLWQTAFTGGASTGSPLRAPVLGEGSAFVALNKAGGGVAVGAFDVTSGRRRWGIVVGSGVEVNRVAALANGVVYLGNENGSLYALNAASGATLATFHFPSGVDSVIVANGRVHVGTAAHGIHTLALP